MTSLEHISIADLTPVQGQPLILNIDGKGIKALQWAEENKTHVERLIQENGALLIRGLKIHSSRQFGQILITLFGDELIEYAYRSTPRTELRGNVYTASEYHHEQVIPQHNENAYSNQWAMRIGFLCMQPSDEGGETPISDSRLIYKNLPVEIREKFEQKQVMYVRNYSDIDLPWSEVFQTDKKEDVEAFCKENDLQFEWLDNNALRTKQINPATQIHPVTGEKIWFNQAHLFHVSSLQEDVRSSLLNIMDEESLPRNTYYGDGEKIEVEVLDLIRSKYEENKIVFPWEKSDLMLLDNMSFTHGRNPFKGERKVLVGMARPAN